MRGTNFERIGIKAGSFFRDFKFKYVIYSMNESEATKQIG